jgi:hypothetical protein
VTDQINHLIAQSGKVAFDAGRIAERNAILEIVRNLAACKCTTHDDCNIAAYEYVIDTIISEREK